MEVGIDYECGPVLSIGASGTDVGRLQRLLVAIELYDWNATDGAFGPASEVAVKDVQAENCLTVDGIVGPILAPGDAGASVAALQSGLKRYAGPDPGPIDGNFGPLTEAAVRAYQTDRVVSQGVGAADGIVGDLTWWHPPVLRAQRSRRFRDSLESPMLLC